MARCSVRLLCQVSEYGFKLWCQVLVSGCGVRVWFEMWCKGVFFGVVSVCVVSVSMLQYSIRLLSKGFVSLQFGVGL